MYEHSWLILNTMLSGLTISLLLHAYVYQCATEKKCVDAGFISLVDVSNHGARKNGMA